VDYRFRPPTRRPEDNGAPPRPLVQAFHDDSVNHGPHLIHTGGRFDSHLLMPHAPG